MYHIEARTKWPFHDETRSPQRMPASHWLEYHRSGWEQEQDRQREREKGEEGRKLKKMQLLCHSILTEY
ncbi:hypothetical protein INR49_005571 [Caranx melampygus]|nr:hypothetical protein INR49_005571 [Caranx melampygus]